MRQGDPANNLPRVLLLASESARGWELARVLQDSSDAASALHVASVRRPTLAP